MHDLSYSSDISGSFFHADDVVYVLYKCRQSLRLDGTSGTARYIVEDCRDLDFIADLCIVCDQSVLCRLIVVRSYEKKSVSAILFSSLESSIAVLVQFEPVPAMTGIL